MEGLWSGNFDTFVFVYPAAEILLYKIELALSFLEHALMGQLDKNC